MIIKNNEREVKEVTEGYSIFDYKVGSVLTGLNLYEIKGRMPETNYMISRKNDRVFYVVDGTGISTVDGIARSVEKGDVIFISTGAKFYFEGELNIVGLKK